MGIDEVDRPNCDVGRAARKRLRTDRSGAAAIEYALLASLVAVAIVGSLILTGTNLSGSMTKVEQAERLTVGPRN